MVAFVEGSAVEGAVSDQGGGADVEIRRANRRSVSKPAQIAFGGTALDCVLVDLSPGGAQVRLKGLVDVPDLLTLRLPGGESRSVRCCWQNGFHVGLMVVGTGSLLASE